MKTRIMVIATAATMLAFAVGMSPSLTFAGDDSEVASSPDATINLSTFQAASVVIGQVDFTGSIVNEGLDTPAADTISNGFGAAAVGPTGALYLSDYDNERVLGFSSIPSTDDADADFVLGQPDFTSTGKGT